MSKVKNLIVGISGVCTTHCSFCYKDSKDAKFFSLERYASLLKELSDLETIEFSGIGEPTLHPEFKQFITTSKELQPQSKLQLVTNGSRLNPNLIDFLEDNSVKQIWVSLNAATEKTHNKIMPGLDFDSIISSIEYIKHTDITLQISFVTTKGNYHEAEDFCKLGTKLKADSILIRGVDFGLSDKIYKEQSVTLEQFKNIYNRIQRKAIFNRKLHIAPKWTFFPDKYQSPKFGSCPNINDTFGVYYANGDVSFCCYMAADKLSIGNVLDGSVSDIWNSSKAQEFRMHRQDICSRCGNYWNRRVV